LNTNIDDAELKHNPVFNYLGTTFDKEGGRGLILNSLDVVYSYADQSRDGQNARFLQARED